MGLQNEKRLLPLEVLVSEHVGDEHLTLEFLIDYGRLFGLELDIWMFHPCKGNDDLLDGDAIFKTNHSDDCYCKSCEDETKRCDEYVAALNRAIFSDLEVFKYSNDYGFNVKYPDDDCHWVGMHKIIGDLYYVTRKVTRYPEFREPIIEVIKKLKTSGVLPI